MIVYGRHNHPLHSGMSRTQIRITVGLLLLAHLSLAPLGLRVDRVPTPADLLVLGALIAQPPLLAIWAVLAPQAFVRRFVQATMVLARPTTFRSADSPASFGHDWRPYRNLPTGIRLYCECTPVVPA